MGLQRLEVWGNSAQTYINIHKSGSTTIRELLIDQFPFSFRRAHSIEKAPGRVLWTVLRDPYDRFVDAISYDIKKVGLEVTAKNLHKLIGTDKLLQEYLFGVSKLWYRDLGYARHSVPQIAYIPNLDDLDMYVDVVDLDIFCEMHFKGFSGGKNMGVPEDRQKTLEFLDGEPLVQDAVRKYLHIDYFMLERLKEANKRWHWTDGPIFDKEHKDTA